jgi:hypothetical protein
MTAYFNVTVFAEWCTLFVAVCILDRRTGPWQFFTIWLMFSIGVETIGWYLHNFKGYTPNALPFNLLLVVRGGFFMAIFLDFQRSFSKWVYPLLAIFILFALVNLGYLQGFWNYNHYSESVADIFVAILCCLLLFSLVTSNEYIIISKNEYFWMSIGFLFYSLGSAFLYNFYNLLGDYRKETGINVGLYLNYALNILLSVSLIIAFICRRKNTRLSSG